MNSETRLKYPRTRHLPSSRSATEDDKIATVEQVALALEGQEVIITEKMDGESTTIYADGHSHARSIDSKFHPSRGIVREIAARISHDLPAGFRVCGENIFAVHSIEYVALESHFQVYNIWEGDRCLSWDETIEWAGLLDLSLVPTIYRGPWLGEDHAHGMWQTHRALLPEEQESEGFVVRLADSFLRENFPMSVFKYVRPRHVQTDEHWMHQAMRINRLA